MIIQQRHLVTDEMAPARTAEALDMLYELVGIRYARTDEGTGVSEWRVTLDDLRDFVARRRSEYISS